MRPSYLRIALCAPVLLTSACATVHPAAPVGTSRPGVVRPTGIVPAGHTQLEVGYTHAEQDGRARDLVGETLLRVGVAPRTEVRAGWASYQRTTLNGATTEGAGDLSVSFKHRFNDPRAWLPAVALTAGSTLPTGADVVSAGEAQPEAALATEWVLPYSLRILGLASHRSAVAAGDRFGSTTLGAAGRMPIGGRVTGQVEYTHATSTRVGAADVGQVRAGAALRLTHEVQLDAYAGRADAAGKHEYLVGVGLTSRW
ncbi:transporter [Longimicrobium sp.]|uniref:transporter n=1 Tax=Longimicrobium sp. TaxID=2029185 RepID=UPI002E33964F|nr:transporter [Longimicrobium sp.]HEX6037025.1 transporter [Longimicrobium sp.]